ncbi:MAG: hypothetical protein JW724_04505 [Candidatus Altiarchaeota archaeon]|nr:hypothetical protein [Candidatus Altiarchaeota archaeon]
MSLTLLDLDRMPEKSIILIEEKIGSVEKMFLHRITFDALSAGKKVLYLAVHNSREDVLAEMSKYSFYDNKVPEKEGLRIEGYYSSLPDIAEMASGYDVCIIDPFPFLVMHKEDGYVLDLLTQLKKLSRREDIRFFLSMDHGVSKESTENMARAMADGIIEFTEETVGRRIERFVRIPKMKGSIPSAEMLPIMLTEDGIMMDTRQVIR